MIIHGLGWERGMNFSASGQGQVVCSYECDKGNLGYIKCYELLD
jgi:hypothetical protein